MAADLAADLAAATGTTARPAVEAFFLPASGGQRWCLHHSPPAGPVRSAWLYLHPWAEEMNKSRRMAAMTARALAQAGHAVLQIDLQGCGDSSGDFAEATWDGWLADVVSASAWLRQRHAGVPFGLWGHRVGALLALQAAARLTPPDRLLLWQPVLSGKQALQQFLRLKAAADLHGGDAKATLERARSDLAEGRAVDVAGYALPPLLAAGLEQAVLDWPSAYAAEPVVEPAAVQAAVQAAVAYGAPAAAAYGSTAGSDSAATPTDSPAGAVQVAWLETSTRVPPVLLPASAARIDAWRAAGIAVHAAAVAGPAFWQTQEIEDAPALVTATVDAANATWTAGVRGAAGAGAPAPALPVSVPALPAAAAAAPSSAPAPSAPAVAAPAPAVAPTAAAAGAAPAAAAGLGDGAAVAAFVVSSNTGLRSTLPETAVHFGCKGDRLLGVLSPVAGPATVGIVVVVGGPQYRVGAHRQFVLLARALAADGYPVLRFDHRGIGDSQGQQRSFEDLSDDIGAAVGALEAACPTVRRTVLWGLCDGASAALLHLAQRPDPRVAGLALLNPWVRSPQSLARTHVKHYYLERLQQRDFWLKLLSGKVALGALSDLFANIRSARGGSAGTAAPTGPFQTRMAGAWGAFPGPILLMLSEFDYTAREFDGFTASDGGWQRALQRCRPTRVSLAGADHTCAAPAAQRAAEQATLQWLRKSVGGGAGAPPVGAPREAADTAEAASASKPRSRSKSVLPVAPAPASASASDGA